MKSSKSDLSVRVVVALIVAAAIVGVYVGLSSTNKHNHGINEPVEYKRVSSDITWTVLKDEEADSGPISTRTQIHRLEEGHSVSLLLVGPDSHPLAQHSTTIRLSHNGTDHSLTTDKRGIVTLEAFTLRDGAELKLFVDGYLPATCLIDSSLDQPQRILFHNRLAATIRVEDQEGRPIRGARVELQHPQLLPSNNPSLWTTDELGNATIIVPHTTAKNPQVLVSAIGYCSASTTVADPECLVQLDTIIAAAVTIRSAEHGLSSQHHGVLHLIGNGPKWLSISQLVSGDDRKNTIAWLSDRVAVNHETTWYLFRELPTDEHPAEYPAMWDLSYVSFPGTDPVEGQLRLVRAVDFGASDVTFIEALPPSEPLCHLEVVFVGGAPTRSWLLRGPERSSYYSHQALETYDQGSDARYVFAVTPGHYHIVPGAGLINPAEFDQVEIDVTPPHTTVRIDKWQSDMTGKLAVRLLSNEEDDEEYVFSFSPQHLHRRKSAKVRCEDMPDEGVSVRSGTYFCKVFSYSGKVTDEVQVEVHPDQSTVVTFNLDESISSD